MFINIVGIFPSTELSANVTLIFNLCIIFILTFIICTKIGICLELIFVTFKMRLSFF